MMTTMRRPTQVLRQDMSSETVHRKLYIMLTSDWSIARLRVWYGGDIHIEVSLHRTLIWQITMRQYT